MSAPITGIPFDENTVAEAPIRIMALHALYYCERLFYLEEVERIHLANAKVYAGRRLHDEVVALEDEGPERRSFEVVSASWGLYGVVDAVRRRDGRWVAYEHKRGRCRRGRQGEVECWPSDRIQAIAYCALLEEALGERVHQARVRYHADNVTAFVEVGDAEQEELRRAIQRAHELRRTTERPPVTDNERLCTHCSLAPVCLPEEERLEETDGRKQRPRLFPTNRERQTLHVVSARSRVSRRGHSLVVSTEEGEIVYPIEQLDTVLIHGHGQITTQAVHLCAHRDVSIHWLTPGGRFVCGTGPSTGRVQQRIRQYEVLAREEHRLRLSRALVRSKVHAQLRYLLRATRGEPKRRQACAAEVRRMRRALVLVERASSVESLLGCEGLAAKAYFACLPHLLGEAVADELRPHGRTRHPPQDRFNAVLSFLYALLQSLVHRSVIAVGLEPSLGFYHNPRTAAHPLVLDLMELFRTPICDMALVASINRGQWKKDEDFTVGQRNFWLSESGRRKAITIFERRLSETYRHPYTGQSLTYARMVELEARLLEKEWSGRTGVFAQWKLR